MGRSSLKALTPFRKPVQPDLAARTETPARSSPTASAAARHPWRTALGIALAFAVLEVLAAIWPVAEAVLFAPERALGVPSRFLERPAALAGPFPPTLTTGAGDVVYPVVLPVFAAFAYAQVTRHARLAYALGVTLFALFPLLWAALGAAPLDAHVVPEALGWGAAVGAVAGLVAGPRSRGTMSRAEATPILALLGLGAFALYPVAFAAPSALGPALVVYAVAGAVVAYVGGRRWRERAVAAEAASGAASGLALAAHVTLPASAFGGSAGLVVALALGPLWTAAALAGASRGQREPS